MENSKANDISGGFFLRCVLVTLRAVIGFAGTPVSDSKRKLDSKKHLKKCENSRDVREGVMKQASPGQPLDVSTFMICPHGDMIVIDC